LVEVAGLEHDHITEQQLLSETLDVKTEQDRRLAQLTDELVLKIAQLEQAEANVAEGKRSAELEQREHAELQIDYVCRHHWIAEGRKA
jgi:energy-converting hydrogenase A subunit M